MAITDIAKSALKSSAKSILTSVAPETIGSVRSMIDPMSKAGMYGSSLGRRVGNRVKLDVSRMSSGEAKPTEVFSRAMRDVVSGDYSFDKITQSNDGFFSFDDDSSDGSYGDDSDEFAAAEIDPKKFHADSIKLQKAVVYGNSASIDALRESSKIISKTQIRASQAMSTQLTNVMTYGIARLSTGISGVNYRLEVINKNLISMIRFQNENTSVTNSAILTFMEAATENLASIAASYKEKEAKSARSYSHEFISSGFNMGEYVKHVKKNIKRSTMGSMLSAAKSGMDMSESMSGLGDGSNLMVDVISSMILGEVADKFLIGNIRKGSNNADKNIQTSIQNLLFRIGDLGRQGEGASETLFNATDKKGPVGALFRFLNKSLPKLGEMLGINRLSSAVVRTSEFDRDNMSWNGIAQKTLVEVIPNYLAGIRAAVEGTEERFFDMEYGTFKTKSQLQKELSDNLDLERKLGFYDVIEKLNTYLDDREIGGAGRENIESRLDSLINDRIRTNSGITEDYKEGLHGILGDVLSKDELRNIFLGIERGVVESSNSILSTANSITNDYNGSSVMKQLFNVAGADRPSITDRGGALFESSSSKRNPFSHITSIDIDSMIQNSITDPMYVFRPSSSFIREVTNMTKTGKSKAEIEKFVHTTVFKDELQWKMRRKMSGGTDEDFADDDTVHSAYDFKRGSGKFRKVSEFLNSLDESFFQFTTGGFGENSQRKTTGEEANITPEEKTSTDQTDSAEILTETSAASSRGSDTSKAPAKTKALALIGKLTGQIKPTDITKMSDKDVTERIATITDTVEAINDESSGEDADPQKTFIQTAQASVLAGLSGYNATLGKTFGKDGTISKFLTSPDRKKEFDKLFNPETGKLKGVSNKVLSGTDYLKHAFTGKGYTTRSGDVVEDSQDSAVSRLKKMGASAYKYVLDAMPISDERKEKIDTYLSGKVAKAATDAADSIRQSADNVNKAVFGDMAAETSADGTVIESKNIGEKTKGILSQIGNHVKGNMPAGLAGAALGLGAMALSGGSLGIVGSLFLPTNPIGAAIVGSAVGIASSTNKFKEIMFGKDIDENGKRTGGLINEKMKGAFKKAIPTMLGGGVLGAISSAFTGSVLPVIGGSPVGAVMGALLPGGVIGGALLGLGASILMNNDKIKNILFGESDPTKEKTSTFFKKSTDAISNFFGSDSTKRGIKRGAIGLAAGAGLGAAGALGSFGVLGGALTAAGPIGLGLAGLGIGIASGNEKFQNILFGKQKFDKDGNPIGRDKSGVVDRLKNAISIELIQPLKTHFNKGVVDFAYWAKQAFLYPFREAMGPIVDSFRQLKTDTNTFMKDKFGFIADSIGDALKKSIKVALTPLLRLTRGVAKGVMNAVGFTAKLTGGIIAAPMKLLSMAMMPKRTKGQFGIIKDDLGDKFSSMSERWGDDRELSSFDIFGKVGRVRDRARDVLDIVTDKDGSRKSKIRAAYGGPNTFDWQGVPEERAKDQADRKAYMDEQKRQEKIQRAIQKESAQDGYNETASWDADRFKRIQRRLRKAGVKEGIDTQGQVKELFYQRDRWNKRYVEGIDPDAAIIEKDRVEKEADKQETSTFRQTVDDKMSDIKTSLDGILNYVSGKIKPDSAETATNDTIVDRLDSVIEATVGPGVYDRKIRYKKTGQPLSDKQMDAAHISLDERKDINSVITNGLFSKSKDQSEEEADIEREAKETEEAKGLSRAAILAKKAGTGTLGVAKTVSSIADKAVSGGSSFLDTIKKIAGLAVPLIAGASLLFSEGGQGILGSIKNAILGGTDENGNYTEGLLATGVRGLSGIISEHGPQIIGSLVDGLTPLIPVIATGIKDMIFAIIKGVGSHMFGPEENRMSGYDENGEAQYVDRVSTGKHVYNTGRAIKSSSTMLKKGSLSRKLIDTVNPITRAATSVDDWMDARKATNVADATVSTGAKAASAAGKVVSETAEKSSSGIIQKFIALIEKSKSAVTSSKAVQAAAGIFNTSTKWIDDVFGVIIKKLKGLKGAIATKCAGIISSKLGKAVAGATTGLLGSAVFMTIGAIGGSTKAETARLFGISEDDVTTSMRTTTAIISALLSEPMVGTWFDIAFTIWELLVKQDLVQEIAVTIWKSFSDDEADILFDQARDQMAKETEIYNAQNNTNLSTDAYSDMKNKGILGGIGDSVMGLFGKGDQTDYDAIEEQAERELATGSSSTSASTSTNTPTTGGGFFNLQNTSASSEEANKDAYGKPTSQQNNSATMNVADMSMNASIDGNSQSSAGDKTAYGKPTSNDNEEGPLVVVPDKLDVIIQLLGDLITAINSAPRANSTTINRGATNNFNVNNSATTTSPAVANSSPNNPASQNLRNIHAQLAAGRKKAVPAT